MQAVYENMTCFEKVITLPKTLEMQDMGCALFEVKGKIPLAMTVAPLYLCADFVEDSFVGSNSFGVLRRLDADLQQGGNIDHKFDTLLWIPCKNNQLNELRLYISDDSGHPLSFNNCQFLCTLLFTSRVHRLSSY